MMNYQIKFMNMLKTPLVLLVIIFISLGTQAQEEKLNRLNPLSNNQNVDKTTAVEEIAIFKDATRLAIEEKSAKAWKRSLVLPGWGQHTNGGLWWIKAPIIYGGFTVGVLAFNFNNQYYHRYLKEAQYRIENHDAYPPDTDYPHMDAQITQSFIRGKDYYRRNRDLTVLITAGWYALNAIEAYVNSMLKYRWNIDNELSVKVLPTTEPILNETTVGLKVAITLP